MGDGHEEVDVELVIDDVDMDERALSGNKKDEDEEEDASIVDNEVQVDVDLMVAVEDAFDGNNDLYRVLLTYKWCSRMWLMMLMLVAMLAIFSRMLLLKAVRRELTTMMMMMMMMMINMPSNALV